MNVQKAHPSKSISEVFQHRLWRCIPVVLAAVCVLSCAQAPRWTPETVAPPASLERVQDEIAQSDAESETTTPPETASSEATIEQPMSLPLTRDGAILTALARNRSLVVERLSRDISAESVPGALAAFDPKLLATASYGRAKHPSSQEGLQPVTDDEPDNTVSRQFQTDLSISEFLPTGTEVFLSGGFSRSRSSSDWDYDGSWSVGVNQSLLRGLGPGVNLVSLRQARNSAAKSQHELRAFVLELAYHVENAYWELVLAAETMKIREFSVQLAQEQLELNADLITVGKLSADAVVSAEAELASQRANLVDARANVKGRSIELIRLLNPEVQSQWDLAFEALDPPETGHVDCSPRMSASLAELYRPELAQSRLDLANRDLEVVQTRNGLLPKLDAFASYGRLSSGTSGSDAGKYLDDFTFDYYEVGLSLDLSPLNRGERASHRKALFQQQQAEAAIENLQQVIEAEVRLAVVEAEQQWERIAATKQTVKSREEELMVEKSRFLVGKSTNLNVSQVRRDLIQAQLDELTARVRYIEALTSLYLSEGTLLARRGVGSASQ